MTDKPKPSAQAKFEAQEKWRFEKLSAKLEKLEGKIDYATLKIRGRTEDTKGPSHAIAPHMVWLHEPYFVRAKAKVKVPGIPDIRCFFLQSCLRSLKDVPGDVAECGVREGKSSFFLLEADEAERDYYLFDSFEGFSDPVAGKDSLKSAIDPNTGARIFDGDFDKVAQSFKGHSNVHLIKGWIPDRFDDVADKTFAFVHVDVDLYQPTLDSFAYFYPRLAPNGILVCDDYGSAHYPGARLAMDEYFADKPETPIELPQGQAFIVKRG